MKSFFSLLPFMILILAVSAQSDDIEIEIDEEEEEIEDPNKKEIWDEYGIMCDTDRCEADCKQEKFQTYDCERHWTVKQHCVCFNRI